MFFGSIFYDRHSQNSDLHGALRVAKEQVGTIRWQIQCIHQLLHASDQIEAWAAWKGRLHGSEEFFCVFLVGYTP